MHWVDVCGPPGVGKSTLCDPLWDHRAIGWDGKPPPAYWHQFLLEIDELFSLIRGHWSFIPALRMNLRSLRKMSSVERMDGDRAYIQAGLVQRGLGFGWRLHQQGSDVNLVSRYFDLMPVSIGVAFLDASVETVIARNHARKLNPATAHEDRAYQAELVQPAIQVAKRTLRRRGIPVIEIDVEHQPIDAARAELIAFAANGPCDAAQMGSCCKDQTISLLPPWWR